MKSSTTVVILIAALGFAAASAEAKEECPCIRAAKDLGVAGEQFNKFEKMCIDLNENLNHVDATKEMKTIDAGISTAEANKADKDVRELWDKKMRLYKSALTDYHAAVKTLFGADLYQKWNSKLPAFYKS